MKRIRYTAWLAGLISLLVLSQAGAEENTVCGVHVGNGATNCHAGGLDRAAKFFGTL
jgi:hypothetical protein